jgi:GalNAc5-diNAcBac-PP-undecaprenol beta-1,3-glucosyltransferase
MKTLFTVVIPTHDNEDTLGPSVASVMGQTIPDFELFIVGDGATARARQMAGDLVRQDARIRFFDLPKAPRHGERNRHQALRSAAGKYVAYLSDDDLYFPTHLQTLLHAFESDVAPNFVHTQHVNVMPDGGIAFQPFDFRSGVAVALLQHPSLHETCGFGTSFGAHTLELYRALPVGWNPAPPGIHSDLHFWSTILRSGLARPESIDAITVLHFDAKGRKSLSRQERRVELEQWLRTMVDERSCAGLQARILSDLMKDYARVWLESHRVAMEGREFRGAIQPSFDFDDRKRLIRASLAASRHHLLTWLSALRP